jgi:hypothetical protein
MIVDAHINLTSDGRWYDTRHDSSVDRALREMDAAGVERSVVIPIAGRENRAFTLDLASRRADRFVTGFAVSSLDEAELSEMRSVLAGGVARMVKIHPRSTGIRPNDPGLAPFLRVAQDFKAPVMFCGYMRGPGVPMEAVAPLAFDAVARAHPDLTIVLSHAGSYRPMDALAVAQSHANVYLDLSHVLEYFRGSSLERDFAFIIERLDRKVIYGSDFPEYGIGSYLERAREVTRRIPAEKLVGFFGGHAQRVYRF